MQVKEWKNGEGNLNKLEFIHTTEGEEPEDFKIAILNYITEHHPMSLQEFFDRLEEFAHGVCRINMV